MNSDYILILSACIVGLFIFCTILLKMIYIDREEIKKLKKKKKKKKKLSN